MGLDMQMSEWYGAEVQMQDPGVAYDGWLQGEQGTPAYQVHLTVRWDVWELVGQRLQVFTYTLRGWSVWHSARKTLRLWYICCTRGMCYSFTKYKYTF